MVEHSQIIMVTMSPRARSSLTMAMLRAMGVEIAGEAFPGQSRLAEAEARRADPKARFRPTASAVERLREQVNAAKAMNPQGFWELLPQTMRGVRQVEPEWAGHAIKVVDHAAWPNPMGGGTDPGTWSHAIVCARDPRAVVESQRDLLPPDLVDEADGEPGDQRQWRRRRHAPDPTRYLMGFGGWMGWLAAQDDAVRERVHVLDTDAMLSDPRAAMRGVAEHLGLDDPDLDAAAALVRTDLNRSTPAPWDERHATLGAIADDLHAATLSRDWTSLHAAMADVEEIRDERLREQTVWVDLEHGTLCAARATLHRALRDNAALRRSLGRSNRVARRDFRRSRWFGGWSEKTYTLRLPADLGHDLERPFVICTHPHHPGVMAVEQFQALHRQEAFDR